MKTQQLMAMLGAGAVIWSTCGAASAASGQEMFADVPQGHWAYGAVAQLKADGLLSGMGVQKFDGERIVTRYQMAKLVASAMAHEAKAAPDDQALIRQLEHEFHDELAELNSLKQRISELEQHQKKVNDNIVIHGSLQQKLLINYTSAAKRHGGNWWEKEIDIKPQARLTGLAGDWTFYTGFVTKLGSNAKVGLNDGEIIGGDWNGGHDRRDVMRLDEYHLDGQLPHTGLYAKIGDFCPWVQTGYVMAANIQGLELDHWGKNYAVHGFAGVLDCGDGDLGNPIKANWVQHADGSYTVDAEPSNVWSDNIRAHGNYSVVRDSSGTTHLSRDGKNPLPAAEEADLYANGGLGGDNAYSNLDGTIDRSRRVTKKAYGLVVDRTFNKRLSGSLGAYRYDSAAYHREPLYIGAITANYRLLRNVQAQAVYAQGNQHGPNSHSRGGTFDIFYRGNPGISTERRHMFGAYIGYHHLAPDTYIKTTWSDEIDRGVAGLAMGCFYNILPNVQLTLKYGNGHSLTARNHTFREKFYSCLSFGF